MRQTVANYEPIVDLNLANNKTPEGYSIAPKALIFHILPDNSEKIDVLDIGFGVGQLGELIKKNESTFHWHIDGVDGWEPNCLNRQLFEKKYYRNVWHGLAQDLPPSTIKKYKIICLIDIVEHLNVETAKWLVRTLLSLMNDTSYLFISTPLWFMPQDQQQEGDLEEHLIGIPITSMLALMPVCYSISDYLVGGFVYGKNSLKYIELFQPCADKSFSYEMGLNLLKICNVAYQPGTFLKISDTM